MTGDEFRRLALSMPDATEGSHMGHADFRVAGKVFATLGYPTAAYAVVMLSPEDQEIVIRAHPRMFEPVKGAWGKRGSTTIRLGLGRAGPVREAIEAAWRRRAPKRLLGDRG